MPLKVLLVEDDVATLELIWEVLTSLGVEVRPLSDSTEAAAWIQRDKFDGVFLDLMMPKLDGFELARQIRRSPSNSRTPIVVVTGREDRETIEQAFAAGATFFLAKPIDRPKLIRLLNSTRGAMLEERRRYQRVPLRAEVTCMFDSRTTRGQSVNVSLSGLLFESEGSLTPGTRIRLGFHLPTQAKEILAEAAVVRVDDQRRAGARFTDMSAEDRQRLRDFVASLDTL